MKGWERPLNWDHTRTGWSNPWKNKTSRIVIPRRESRSGVTGRISLFVGCPEQNSFWCAKCSGSCVCVSIVDDVGHEIKQLAVVTGGLCVKNNPCPTISASMAEAPRPLAPWGMNRGCWLRRLRGRAILFGWEKCRPAKLCCSRYNRHARLLGLRLPRFRAPALEGLGRPVLNWPR